MSRKLIGALVMSGALLLSACAGGTTTAEEAAGGGETAEATGPRTLLLYVDPVREPAALAYQASVEGEIEVTVEVLGYV